MRFGSVCSGIEAASVAWHPLGWTTAFVAEIEPFPAAVLAKRFGASRPKYMPDPDEAGLSAEDAAARRAAIKALAAVVWGDAVTNYGDFTRIIDEADAPEIDLLVGGTPCQAFSVAGARQSLADARGNLTLEFVRLVHASKHLRWAVWENVPGVLSTDDNAFGCFLAGLVGSGAPLCVPDGSRWPDAGMVAGPLGRAAWRVLDAQHFGLAQRRRRVFVVFCPAAAGGDPAAVLFERQGVPWDIAASGGSGEGPAGGAGEGVESEGICAELAPALTSSGRGVPRPGETRGQDPVVAYGGGNRAGPVDVAACHEAGGNKQDFEVETFVAHTLRADGFDASEDRTGRGTPLIPVHAFDARQSDVVQYGNLSGPLDTDGGSVGEHADAPVAGEGVRRLTPTECERLQGFPDGHTDILWKGKPAPDGPRYKSLGNSMATTVMAWLGQRIAAAEAGELYGWRFDWTLLPWVRRGGNVIAVDTYNQALGDTAATIRSGAGPDGIPAVMS